MDLARHRLLELPSLAFVEQILIRSAVPALLLALGGDRSVVLGAADYHFGDGAELLDRR